ncbi:aminotransferase class I/II-fold pyridoxal phosphate-dependent enzyme [Sneathia sanguinegens]|jgi:hypothetical protein|uniref:MalY/PatB family protein n=1 Tax=Sneathia sanguinegens TaxID=40543 RepID=UPI00258BDA31|nr:aminotransferase class I/II-fold pyridoxal phosphate-dependent enzyme [Sneathia sanguinegens]MDU4651966.1 aminotransferase class I/II-fold pyridoxal phosphate-dependent enzyme [Sneathia sanguinegens]
MKYNFDEEFDRSKTYTRKWDRLEKGVIPMNIADLDYRVCPNIQKELEKVAKSSDYSYTYVRDEYYNALINWHKKRLGVDIKKEDIKLVFGTCSVLHYIVQCFAKEHSNILINTPCYEPFVLAVRRNNCTVIANELVEKDNKYYIDFKKLEEDIIKYKVKIYILCNPQNPSGRIWTREELQKVVDLCEKYKVLLVSDEVHRDILRKNESFVSILNLTNNAIVCCSPNKTFNLGGLKGSYIIIQNKDIRDKMLKYLEKVYVTSPHVFMQAAHITAYTECDEWVKELNEYIDKNFEYFESFMKNNLPNIQVMKAQAGFLAWINMKQLFKSEEEMKKYFDKIKVLPVYGTYFSEKSDSGWVRLNLGCTMKTLKTVLNRMLLYR